MARDWIYGTVFADVLPAVGLLESAETPAGGEKPEDDEAQEGEKA